jgi:Zn-dependent peptidase ImmA (M78 family)
VIETCFPDIVVTGAALPKTLIEMAEVGADGRRNLLYRRGIDHATQRVGLAHGLHHFLSDLKVARAARRRGHAECNTNLRWLERSGKFEKDPIEVACDLFAGELLTPFDVLDTMAPKILFPSDKTKLHLFLDEVDSLASRFNVPADFIQWRLADLAHLRRSSFYVK